MNLLIQELGVSCSVYPVVSGLQSSVPGHDDHPSCKKLTVVSCCVKRAVVPTLLQMHCVGSHAL